MSLFAALFATPIDRTAPVPISNKAGTIYGATLPFHILTWAAVIFRVYTRLKIIRDPGWDDFFIILSAIFNLVALVGFYGGAHTGLGKHLVDVDFNGFVQLFKFIYIQNAAYYTCAGIVKISLLCQYLRVFKKGALRYVTVVLTVVVSLWTTYWFIQGWFPCFPVSGFWDRTHMPAAKCWGTGFGDLDSALLAFVSFAASNMVLDTIIFIVPIAMVIKPGLGSRQVLALLALFGLGSIVLLMSILRLWTAARHNKDDPTSLDFTWWYPLTMILSALEIDFAIICASIPIFWPVIISKMPQIFVTQEVHVTHTARSPINNNVEYEMSGAYSLKSNGSEENLTHLQTPGGNYYKDQHVMDHVTGKLESTTHVAYEKQMRRK